MRSQRSQCGFRQYLNPSSFGYVGDAKMCFYMLFPLVPPNVVKGIIYIYIIDGSDLRYDGMVSFSRGTMRTKHAPKGRLVLLIGDVHRMTCQKWRTNSFVEWTSGGMVVIFQGGGNKKLADVGPWLRDKIVERFKQAILWDQDGPGREWQP